MKSSPNEKQILEALIEAGRAHHEFQANYFGGVRQSQWAGWYSASVLGRLGNFTTPTILTKLLEEVKEDENWFKNAAKSVIENIKDK